MIIDRNGEVTLRHLEESDLPQMTVYANNPNVTINLRDAFPSPYTEEDAYQFFEIVKSQNPQTILAIAYRGAYVGNISLILGSDVYRKSANIGYFIGEPFWNNGIVTKAVPMMVKFGFENLDIVRIDTSVFAYNGASQRVLEKCRFKKEAVCEKAIYKQGQFFNEVRYAILKY